MKKIIACLVALSFVTSCAQFGMNKDNSASNKYSATKASDAKKVVKKSRKSSKRAKRHGGSEVK